MPFPVKVCAVCSEEFELKPGKPGFANRCPACSVESEEDAGRSSSGGYDRRGESEINAERRKAIRDLLYKRDS